MGIKKSRFKETIIPNFKKNVPKLLSCKAKSIYNKVQFLNKGERNIFSK